jgi:hypothetical protein
MREASSASAGSSISHACTALRDAVLPAAMP